MQLRDSDASIQKNVQDELAWDARVDPSDIGVSVHEGVVVLNGVVNSWGKRLAAQDAAQRVPGVLDVVNDLDLKLVGFLVRDDIEIAKAARSALRFNVSVPHERIHTVVADGVVTLRGEVERIEERHDAERAVAHLTGVKEVVNQLAVRSVMVAAHRQHAVAL